MVENWNRRTSRKDFDGPRKNRDTKGHVVGMEKVELCLVGAGRAGTVHAKNLSNNVPSAVLKAIVDPNAKAAGKLASETGVARCYSSLDDAIAGVDFDAVVVTTPTFTHAELAKLAASAGKHVFCEKPMALSLGEAEEMISTCRAHNVSLQIGFMRRFDEGFLKAKEMIEDGKIGDVTIIKSTGRGPGLPPRWACDPKTSLGMLAEVNSHDFDSVRWLAGSEYSRVYADAGTFKCFDLKKDFPDFYDNSIVSLRFRNGTLGLIDGSCPVEYGYDARMEVLGTKGVIMIGALEDTALALCTKEEGVVTSAFPSWRDRFKDAYISEIRHFVECILEDREPVLTGEDGKKAVEIVLAATKSILTGEPVELPLPQGFKLPR